MVRDISPVNAIAAVNRNPTIIDTSEVTALRGMSISNTALENFAVPDERELDEELVLSVEDFCSNLLVPKHLQCYKDQLISAYKDHLLTAIKKDNLYQFLVEEIKKVKRGSMRREVFIRRWFEDHFPSLMKKFEERSFKLAFMNNALVIVSDLPVEIINLRVRSYFIDIYVFRLVKELYIHAFRRARVFLNDLKRFHREFNRITSIVDDLLDVHEEMVNSRMKMWSYLKFYNISTDDIEGKLGQERLEEIFKKLPMKAPLDDSDFELLRKTFEYLVFSTNVALSRVISMLSIREKTSILPPKILDKLWLNLNLEPHIEQAFTEIMLAGL